MSIATLVNLVHYTNVGFILDTTVTFDPDQEVTSLAGATATIKARAANSPSSAVIEGTTAIDVPNNQVRGTFDPGDLAVGVYNLQLRVVIDSNPKMLVAGTLTVKAGL